MKYAALFKGINVGGKNIVKMKDLEQMLLGLGIHKVKTYIQSGNALIDSELDEIILQDRIQTSFEEHFGFKSEVLIRSMDQLQYLIEQFPFTETEINEAVKADSQVEHLYIYFLDTVPEQSQIDTISKGYDGLDTLRVGKKEIYFLCYQSIRKSKLATRISKTYKTATVRNWKTTNKLFDMLNNL